MFQSLPGITEVPNRKKERKKERKLMRSRIRFGTSNPGSCPAGGGRGRGGSTRSPVTLSQPVLVPW